MICSSLLILPSYFHHFNLQYQQLLNTRALYSSDLIGLASMVYEPLYHGRVGYEMITANSALLTGSALLAIYHLNYNATPGIIVKREVSWVFFTSFGKNGEIRPSLCYKIILEQREERNQLNSCQEQLVLCSSAFWKQKYENLKNISLTFFKFQSTPIYSVAGQGH